ncbi:MAG: hypothetical protein LLF94_09960 [Chlamydiales bacterium]|nr:hypothetical protein [Chlamydiales bacterium]
MTVKTYQFGQQDLSLLYCKGICANFEDDTQRAGFEEQTNLLRSVFPHRKVVVFNNPTGIGEFFSDSQAQKEKTEAIADQFRKVILSQLESRPDLPLPIVVHSHGALIAKLALEGLDRAQREKLHVYACGGVVMLPKSLGHSVRNFVFKGDLISRNANKKFDPEGILQRIMKVTKRSLRKGIDIKDALFTQFKKDWFGEY